MEAVSPMPAMADPTWIRPPGIAAPTVGANFRSILRVSDEGSLAEGREREIHGARSHLAPDLATAAISYVLL
jgi:hypothetical protein